MIRVSKLEDLVGDELSKEELKLLKTLRKQGLSEPEMKALIRGFRYPKNQTQIKKYNHGSRKINFKFAIIGDTHFGNKSVDKQALWHFYKECKKKGVKDVYHAGDMVDGLHVHRGQEYELYALGLEQQCADVIKEYPQIKGMTTYYIKGNHDLWYDQNAGASIDARISKERPDLICLGDSEADVTIAKKSTLRLMHPGGGSSYALSYKAQKIMESIEGGNKPNILAIGHYHKALQMFYRNIFCFLVGTFEHQTPFMRSKNLSAHLGGWIIEGKAGKNGGIKEMRATFIPYMKL